MKEKAAKQYKVKASRDLFLFLRQIEDLLAYCYPLSREEVCCVLYE